MSNTPPLRTLHGRGAFMSRPRHTWKGWRPPRSARKRWEVEQAFLRAQKAAQLVDLPEQPDPACTESFCQAADSMGLVMAPWQHELIHELYEEKSNA